MNRILILVLLIIVTTTGLFAQRRNGLIGHRRQNSGYLSVGLGPSYCYADPYASVYSISFLNGNNYHTSISYQHFFSNKNFSVRGQFTFANFAGQDRPDKSHDGNHQFYSYVSNNYQVSARAEYGIAFGQRFKRRVPNTLYGFAGLGGMMSEVNFPPNASPGKAGSSFIAFIPLGFGYRYDINSQFSIGAEYCNQVVFSDLVDGYEGSHIVGIPIIDDNIAHFALTFTYKLF